MNQSTIAAKLLTLLASGGTIERVISDLPMFKTHIESAFEWMKTSGRCSAAEITEQTARLRELVVQKDEAIKQQDFDLAARRRADEWAIYEKFRLSAGKGSAVVYMGVDEQIRELSALLHDTKAA